MADADEKSTATSDQASDTATTATAHDHAEDAFDKDRALATIGKLREFERLSKTQERELRELRASVKAAEDAKLSETERQTKRIAELEATAAARAQELQRLQVGQAVSAAASKHGAPRPDLVARLVDAADLEFADDGRPRNADAVVKALKQEYPELFRAAVGSADAAAGTRSPVTNNDMNAQIRQQAGRG